jgi:hypothetical protein
LNNYEKRVSTEDVEAIPQFEYTACGGNIIGDRSHPEEIIMAQSADHTGDNNLMKIRFIYCRKTGMLQNIYTPHWQTVKHISI